MHLALTSSAPLFSPSSDDTAIPVVHPSAGHRSNHNSTHARPRHRIALVMRFLALKPTILFRGERMSTLHPNEIRDYLQRAPKRFYFDGGRMVNTTHVRLKWLSEIARGTIDVKINRRAGIPDPWKPFHNPVANSRNRHHSNELRKHGLRSMVRHSNWPCNQATTATQTA